MEQKKGSALGGVMGERWLASLSAWHENMTVVSANAPKTIHVTVQVMKSSLSTVGIRTLVHVFILRKTNNTVFGFSLSLSLPLPQQFYTRQVNIAQFQGLMSLSLHEVSYCHTTCQVSYGNGGKKPLLQLVSCTKGCGRLPTQNNYLRKRDTKAANWDRLNPDFNHIVFMIVRCQNCQTVLTVWHITHDCQNKQKKLDFSINLTFQSREETPDVSCHMCAHMQTLSGSKNPHNCSVGRNDERIHNQNWWTEGKANEPIHCCNAPAPSSPFFSSLEKWSRVMCRLQANMPACFHLLHREKKTLMPLPKS